MIKDPAVIDELLTKLKGQVIPRYQESMQKIAAYARRRHKLTVVNPWDFNYINDKAIIDVYNAPAWKFAQYFEFSHVKKFTLAYLEKLFELRFIPATEPARPNCYVVQDQRTQQYLAVMEFTPLPPAREKLIVGQMVRDSRPAPCPAEKLELPHLSVNCAFMTPGSEQPLLLNQDDLRNLFHELGHALESAFTYGPATPSASKNYETDVNEVYSCLLENFATSPEFLTQMAAHYKTGKKIPRKILTAAQELDRDRELIHGCYNLELSLKERALNGWPTPRAVPAALEQIDAEVYGAHRVWCSNPFYEATAGLLAPAPAATQYFCNRHCYLLGRVLGRALFEHLRANQSLFRPGLGTRLRDEIFTQRAQRSFYDSYRAYTGAAELEIDLETYFPAPSRTRFWNWGRTR